MSTQLQNAISVIKAGDKKTGKQLLTKTLQADPHNETAWLWMAHAVDSQKQRQECLERVLTINPKNEKAKRGLASLNGAVTCPPPARTAPPPPPEVAATSPPPQTQEKVPHEEEVKPNASRLWWPWLLLCLVAALGIFFGLRLMERWNKWIEFAQSGVTTRATVIDLRKDSNAAYLTYRFEVPTAAGLDRYRKEQSVSPEIYNLLEPGSQVRVQYLFDNPTIVRIGGSDNLNGLLLWTALGLVTGTAGLTGLVGGLGWTLKGAQARFKKKPAKPKEVWQGEGPPPLKQWSGTYTFGQDNYEGYFVIETDDGIFLGEGGMEIFKSVPGSSPKQTIAFDVGLFDKTDITTLSRVVMSEHAYQDEILRASLEANPNAEAVLAQPGASFTLTSTAMRVEAKIEEMAYGEGGNVYFERLTVSLAIFLQEGIDLAQPMDVPDQFK